MQSLSCVQLFCDTMDYSMPGFPVLHCLLGFAQIHVLGSTVLCSTGLDFHHQTRTTEPHLRFGPAASSFLELLVITLCSSQAYLLVSSLFAFSYSFGVLLARILWSGLPFPSPVDHVLSVLFALTRPSWVALHSMTLSFTELHRPLHHKAVFREGEVTWGSGSCGTFGLSS